MCERGTWEIIQVKIPADLSSTGEEKWKIIQVDACLAAIIRALQRGGVDMRSSCCGHGKEPGYIDLQDGRRLVITRWPHNG